MSLAGAAALAAPSAFANVPPSCSAFSASGTSGQPIHLQADCTDPDHGPNALTYSIVNNPSAGSVGGNPNTGSATYTSLFGFTGDDSFTYRAFDGADFSAPATVTIDVTGTPSGNQPPECPDSNAFVESGGHVDLQRQLHRSRSGGLDQLRDRLRYGHGRQSPDPRSVERALHAVHRSGRPGT